MNIKPRFHTAVGIEVLETPVVPDGWQLFGTRLFHSTEWGKGGLLLGHLKAYCADLNDSTSFSAKTLEDQAIVQQIATKPTYLGG